MPTVLIRLVPSAALPEGWHEVAELDVERDLVRLRRKDNDDGPSLDDADEEDRLPVRMRRWRDWLAT